MKQPVVLTRAALYERVWLKPMSALAREFGVTGNALAKICSRVNVPYPSRGYWAKVGAGKAQTRVALPADPKGKNQKITISHVRANSRRAQTRLTREARREQLVAAAAAIVAGEGAHAASMKRIAREAGVSETQVYNYFPSHEKLLVEIARRELTAIQAGRQAELERGHDHYSRLALSIKGYLNQVAERGALLQELLCNPDVRLMLREDHRARRDTDMQRHADRLVQMFGVTRPVALGCTVILTSLSLRAGKLVANKKISAALAERLCVAMTVQGSRDTISAAKNPIRG